MIRKLRKKFVLAAVVSVFLVLFLLIGAINVVNYRSLVRDADGTLQMLAENKGAFPRQMFRPEDLPPLPEGVSEEMAPPPAERPDGLFREPRGGFGELAYQSRYFTVWFDEAGSLSRMNLENIASLEEDEARTLAESVYALGREKGFAEEYRYNRTVSDGETMLLFLNCQRELGTIRSFLYGSIGISLLGMFGVFLLLLLFSGRIIRLIAESYEKQKRFITDAGHELKTPITIIQADADVLESEMEEENNEWITDIRRQTHRLTELTGELIYLSRMEEENVSLQTEEFSFSELTEETALSFQSVARAQGKDFRLSVTPGLLLNGDRKAIGKLVSILLDNAMKYSPENGWVELSLTRVGKLARLRVRNSSLPMEPGNADRLFERFTREDRSRNSETGGFGLGLAIAKAVTEAHRGSIHAVSEDGASLTVTADLPLN